MIPDWSTLKKHHFGHREYTGIIGVYCQRGKTTSSKLVLGLHPMEDGDIVIDGKSVRREPLAEIRKIADVP